jgi:nucleoside-diphosphate-sugar epimerase
VRVISRSVERLRASFADADVEPMTADALDAESTRRALDGCAVAVDCVGLPADRVREHVATARSLAAAMKSTGTRGLQVSSYWSYLPQRGRVIDESHPREGGNLFIRSRREAEDVLRAAGAAIVHLPDFFGPLVHTSTVQNALSAAAAGRAMSWIGSPDVEREYAFVPDAMRIVADLLEREDAYGRDWAVPGSGPVSAAALAELAGRHLGRRVAMRAAPPWLLRVVALASADLRSFMPMVPYYVVPVGYDAAKLRRAMDGVTTTPYEPAVAQTLDWLVTRATGPGTLRR